jgi:hypothetical protein
MTCSKVSARMSYILSIYFFGLFVQGVKGGKYGED